VSTPNPASTLLVIEDEPDDRFLIERALAKARIANPVQMVVDGDEAVAYLSGEGRFADRTANPLPILVLLDLKLPRRSGLEVLEWIRSTPHVRRIPVVVLTSSADSADVQRAYDRGANSYLVKPVEFEALHQMIETLGLYWLVLNRLPRVETE
jgi:CheY-like chemotaxis protein